MYTEIQQEQLLSGILHATTHELDEIIHTAAERFQELYPEWELMTFSVHGHDAQSHIQALQQSIDLLRSRI